MERNRYSYGNPNMAYGPMWPIVAPWMQMMQAWMSVAGAFVPGGYAPQPWNPYATRDSSGCADPAPSAPTVSVRVKSEYPTEVEASIHPGADAMCLKADPLEPTDDEHQPALKGVTIKCECGHVRVSLTIATSQPSGRYSGAIRDAGGCKRGDLTVEVWNPQARQASAP
jgi:hypothetical protein